MNEKVKKLTKEEFLVITMARSYKRAVNAFRTDQVDQEYVKSAQHALLRAAATLSLEVKTEGEVE